MMPPKVVVTTILCSYAIVQFQGSWLYGASIGLKIPIIIIIIIIIIIYLLEPAMECNPINYMLQVTHSNTAYPHGPTAGVSAGSVLVFSTDMVTDPVHLPGSHFWILCFMCLSVSWCGSSAWTQSPVHHKCEACIVRLGAGVLIGPLSVEFLRASVFLSKSSPFAVHSIKFSSVWQCENNGL